MTRPQPTRWPRPTFATASPGPPPTHRLLGAHPPGPTPPTGTDPDATYDQPGYEDKSLGQAVAQDSELVDQLMDETGGDEDAAAARFADESAGRTTLSRQESAHQQEG